MSSVRVLLAVAVLCLLFPFQLAEAATFQAGDIIITEFYDGWHRIDPVTGNRTHLNYADTDSAYLALDDDGNIVFADDTDSISRLNTMTGQVTVLPVSGVQFIDGVAVEDNGDILISESDSIDRFQPDVPATSELATETFFSPRGLARSSDGRVFITEFFDDLLEVNPVTGGVSSVTSFDLSLDLITVLPDGDLIVRENLDNYLIRMDPDTGAYSTFSTDLPTFPHAIAAEADGDVLMTSTDGVFRFDGTTGVRSLLFDETFFNPFGILVIPENEAIPGDYNGDLKVDDLDYRLWQELYGSTTDLRADGTGDEKTDIRDYVFWRDLAAPVSQSAHLSSAVPEPSSTSLALLLATCLGLRRVRKRCKIGQTAA